MAWQYDKSVDATQYEGFIYLITHIASGRMYVGKKSVWTYKKRKRFKPSKWEAYWSSSADLKQLIKQDGEAAFTRTILHWCTTKRAMTFLEAEEQMARNVLHAKLPNGDYEYFNRNIMSRFFRNVLD